MIFWLNCQSDLEREFQYFLVIGVLYWLLLMQLFHTTATKAYTLLSFWWSTVCSCEVCVNIEGYLSRAEVEHVVDNWIHWNYILAFERESADSKILLITWHVLGWYIESNTRKGHTAWLHSNTDTDEFFECMRHSQYMDIRYDNYDDEDYEAMI